MKKILVTILTFIFAVSLCINFVRYLVFIPSMVPDGKFASVSAASILQAFSEFNVDGTGVLNMTASIAKRLLSMGENFTSMFSIGAVDGRNVFEIVKGFFVAFGKSFTAFIDISGLIVLFLVVVGKYLIDAIFALFKFLNTLLGLDLVAV